MANDNDKVMRHAAIDRLFHWATAATMTVLLATSLLPIVGVRFAWYQIHWIAGIILTVAILLHIIRALFWQRLRTITLRAADLSGKPAGKYTVAQKLMHLGWTVAVLVAIVTGLIMMKKAGVPFLEPDPYVFTLKTWGHLTLLHDLAALLSVFLILVHVYFAILPEKRAYLRAMVSGWITRRELRSEHDLDRVARGD
jgi:cytochrome b subunit of formate dehydrogenase